LRIEHIGKSSAKTGLRIEHIEKSSAKSQGREFNRFESRLLNTVTNCWEKTPYNIHVYIPQVGLRV